MPLELNGTTGVQGNSGAFVAGTAVASTSGTSINFTSIPSWVKRVTVSLSGVSTNGTSNPLIQIGAGSVTTSGYLGASTLLGASASTTAYTTGFGIRLSDGASNLLGGSLVLTLISPNTWAASGTFSRSDFAGTGVTSGSVPLAGTLDRVRITTVNGTDTFDAGSINILYE